MFLAVHTDEHLDTWASGLLTNFVNSLLKNKRMLGKTSNLIVFPQTHLINSIIQGPDLQKFSF